MTYDPKTAHWSLAFEIDRPVWIRKSCQQ